MFSIINTDRGAAALSTACIVHCIGLPVLAIALPTLGAASEIEAVHWVLAVLTIMASASIVWRVPDARIASFMVPAGLGAALLVFGLLAEGLGIEETIPNLIGGILLAGAHLWRIRHSHSR